VTPTDAAECQEKISNIPQKQFNGSTEKGKEKIATLEMAIIQTFEDECKCSSIAFKYDAAAEILPD